jgi:hypothetical protein
MFAFVLMPFDPKFDDIYKLGIKETAEKLGISAERVDEQIFHKENILERIYNQINAADFIISDMTGRNPNVFYETGYAHAKGKTCLLLTSDADDIPFDLKHHRHIVYGNSIQNLRLALENELISVQADVVNRQSVITVETRAIGELEKTVMGASAKVDLVFDFHNRTNAPSPEIDAIYFYTGRGWSFVQEGQACHSTDSDERDFARRHFLRVPLRRLPSQAWAQVKITGKKWLAYGKKEELKDKYRLTGRTLVRIITADGTFDHPVTMDLEVEEFPF